MKETEELVEKILKAKCKEEAHPKLSDMPAFFAELCSDLLNLDKDKSLDCLKSKVGKAELIEKLFFGMLCRTFLHTSPPEKVVRMAVDVNGESLSYVTRCLKNSEDKTQMLEALIIAMYVAEIRPINEISEKLH